MDSTRVLETVATLHRQLLAGADAPPTGHDATLTALLEALVADLDLAGAALVLADGDGTRVLAVPDTLAATEPAQLPAAGRSGADGVREDGRLLVSLRLGEEVAGSLTSYVAEGRAWPQADVDAVVAVAGILAGALVAARRLGEREATIGQLQHALDSRVLIEQAKGMVAARHGVDVEEAFELVRAHARSHHVTVHAVSDAIVHLGLQLTPPGQPGPDAPGRPGPH